VSLANLAVLLFAASECLYLSVRSSGTTASLVRAYFRLALLFGALPAAALTVDHSLAGLGTPGDRGAIRTGSIAAAAGANLQQLVKRK
jgi:hypothetical protein